MVEEYAFKCCRVCRGDINLDVLICPFCGSRQQVKQNTGVPWVTVALALLGVCCIMFFGIMSAFAIPRLHVVRTSTSNARALKNVRAAKSGVETFRSRNGMLPARLETIPFIPDDGVTVCLQISPVGTYQLRGFHERGDREYVAFSGNTAFFFRERDRPGAKFVPVE